MGKQSRRKKEKTEIGELEKERKINLQSTSEKIYLFVITWGVYLILLTPLIVRMDFFFPFTGAKSLYFIGLVQIIFFAYLFLIILAPEYRPKKNPLVLAVSLFAGFLILSSILGADFLNSFWSKFERMTGLLMWLHLFVFFIVISSVFQNKAQWLKVFKISIFVAVIVSLISLGDKIGIEPGGLARMNIDAGGGSTIGNTSFMGTYLLFNIFLALFLFFQPANQKFLAIKKINWGLKIFSLLAIILSILAVYLSGARAAFIVIVSGFVLLFLFWLAFSKKNKLNAAGLRLWYSVARDKLKLVGIFLLIISIIAVFCAAYFLFQPGSIIEQKAIQFFSEGTVRGRMIVWRTAWQGFLERPWLGWGLENFDLVFAKHFEPCLPLPECGGEKWYDRAHSIILDTLVTTGILGFLSYLSLFGALFYILIKKYFKEKSIDFWTFGIFFVIPISYFFQNLTVFDMVSSLMIFFVILGFGAFLANTEKRRQRLLEKKGEFILKYECLRILLLIIFGFTFLGFVIQPIRAGFLAPITAAVDIQDSQERIQIYKKTLEMSPLGRHQIREHFALHSKGIIQENIQIISKESIKKELDFVAEQLKKTKIESPLNYRAILLLAHIYNVYTLIDVQKSYLAKKYGERAIELSQGNQQGYMVLAQTKLYQQELEEAFSLVEKAVELEPKINSHHFLLIRIAVLKGDYKLAEEKFRQAIKINPGWEGEIKKILEKFDKNL